MKLGIGEYCLGMKARLVSVRRHPRPSPHGVLVLASMAVLTFGGCRSIEGPLPPRPLATQTPSPEALPDEAARAGLPNADSETSEDPWSPHRVQREQNPKQPVDPSDQNLRPRSVEREPKRPGKVTYKGSLSRAEIESVLRAEKDLIKVCYDQELANDGSLAGKIVPQFVIAGDGHVSSVKAIQDTMGSESVRTCLLTILQGLTFPPPRGGGNVLVTYPYVFR